MAAGDWCERSRRSVPGAVGWSVHVRYAALQRTKRHGCVPRARSSSVPLCGRAAREMLLRALADMQRDMEEMEALKAEYTALKAEYTEQKAHHAALKAEHTELKATSAKLEASLAERRRGTEQADGA